MKLAPLVVALCLLAAPAQALTVSDIDFGGNIMTYIQFWTSVAKTGDSVVIDAPCISACTFFLGFVKEDNICITPRGSLGVHQVNDGDTPDPVFSAAFYRWLYPEWVQQWIKNHGGLTSDPQFIYPEDMKDHIALCPGYSYDSVTADELINHKPSLESK